MTKGTKFERTKLESRFHEDPWPLFKLAQLFWYHL